MMDDPCMNCSWHEKHRVYVNPPAPISSCCFDNRFELAWSATEQVPNRLN